MSENTEIEVKETKSTTLGLSIGERFKIATFIPQKGDMLLMSMSSELIELFSVSEEEAKKAEIVAVTNAEGMTAYKWNPDKDFVVEFKLSEGQVKILKDQQKIIADKKEITLENIKLAKKIEDLTI